jgi:hypothetical protein
MRYYYEILVQELLHVKFQMIYGRQYVLVSWAGCCMSDDTWEQLDSITDYSDCEEDRRLGLQAGHRSAAPNNYIHHRIKSHCDKNVMMP